MERGEEERESEKRERREDKESEREEREREEDEERRGEREREEGKDRAEAVVDWCVVWVSVGPLLAFLVSPRVLFSLCGSVLGLYCASFGPFLL